MIATALYSVVPDGMRARVFGALTAGVAASMPVGALLAGVTVEAFGLGGVLAGAAVLYAVLGASPLLLRSFDGLSSAGRAASVVDRDDEAQAGAAADAPRSAAETVR